MRQTCVLFITAICGSAFGQSSSKGITYEVALSIGNNALVRKIPNLDNQASMGLCFSLIGKYRLKNDKSYLITGLCWQESRFIVDGYFFKSGNENHFSITPDNYKLNDITLGSIEIPCLLGLRTHGTVEKGFGISVGPYLGYLVQKTHKYEIAGTKYEQGISLDNELQWGAIFDVGTIGNQKRSFAPSFGFGIKYQIGNYLDGEKSFNPIFTYFRIGLSN
jgi:hypothetical protein